MYLNVFISNFIILVVYSNVFEFIYNIFYYTGSIFSIYVNVFMVYLWCIHSIFTDIIIGIFPSHSHYKIFAIHIHLYICFSLSTMTTFPTYFATTSFFAFPLICFNFHVVYKSITYQFLLFMSRDYPISHNPCR
jgi:hypothetical protein